MKQIPLTNGGFALVDDEDYEYLSKVRWQKYTGTNGYSYALSTAHPQTRMHRVITGAKKGQRVDHINHDTLDNTRTNLRLVTQSQNQQNRLGARIDSSTGVRGVTRIQNRPSAYVAYARLNGKRYGFGHYRTLEEAEQAAIAGRAALMTHADGR